MDKYQVVLHANKNPNTTYESECGSYVIDENRKSITFQQGIPVTAISFKGIPDDIAWKVQETPYLSFWEAMQQSKEGDILECEYRGYQRIVNNGDYTFMWEDDWKHIKLSGEFIGLKWRTVQHTES